MKTAVPMQRGKADTLNSYSSWAVVLRKKVVGHVDKEDPRYTYPKVVLDALRSLVSGNIKGEFHDDANCV